ncbi:hypothetical protein ACQP1O_19185 [Nocardia sp. CA-151230]|uniref:hypothetical protein n=1 Tax=Nocardia sp. CA-151230 TaxID=3239982 RepID=UPI003D8E1AAC
MIRRFEQEADVVARLEHPNIIVVHDHGSTDDCLWIAMQYIEGTDASRVEVDPDDVFDFVDAWMKENRRVWLRTATDPATGLMSMVIWGRADDGRPLAVFARRIDRDIEIYSAEYLASDQTSDFEKWEATRND